MNNYIIKIRLSDQSLVYFFLSNGDAVYRLQPCIAGKIGSMTHRGRISELGSNI